MSGLPKILFAIAAVAFALLAWWFRARVHVSEDFVLARRRLSVELTGLGQAAQCVPAWMLLAIVTAGYSLGLAALWMVLAMLIGLVVNWWFVAPQLRAQTGITGSTTLSHWIAANAGENLQAAMRRSIGAIVVTTLGLATVTLLQWAALVVGNAFAIDTFLALLCILFLLALLTTVAGMWLASGADLAQTVLLAALLLLGAGYALSAAGGVGAVWQSLDAKESVAGPWLAGYSGVLAIALLIGMLFAALTGAAQPQAIARYLACRDDASLQRARWWSLGWAVVVLLLALIAGWCARVVLDRVPDTRDLLALLGASNQSEGLQSAVAAVYAVVFALASVSLLLTMATHLAGDISRIYKVPTLTLCRGMVAVAAALVGIAAYYIPLGGEDRLWFCWQALGAAFGPLVLVRLTGKRVRPGSSLGAMWSGFLLSIVFHLMPDTPGDLLERCLPFVAAMGIALSGGERRRNPDRADRGDKTVHDHLPI